MRPASRLWKGLFEGLPTTFLWLWAGGFISALASFAFPFLALSLTARGVPPRTVGQVLSLLGFGVLLAGPLAGYFCDRVGRRRTLLASLLLASAGASALGLVRSSSLTFLAALLFGISSSAAASPIQAMVADLVAPEARARAFALLYWASNVGTGFSLVAGGFLAARGWALPFLTDASTTLAFALVVLARVRETRPLPEERAPEAAAKAGYALVLRDGAFLAFLVALVPFALVFYQVGVTLPIDMARSGLSPKTYGLVLSVNTALVVALQPFAPRLFSRCAHTTVLAVSAGVVGLGYGAYALASSAASYAVATAVWSLGEIGYAPAASAQAALLAPPEMRGRYAGAFALCMGGAAALAPLLGTGLLQVFGRRVLFLSCLGLAALSSAALLALGRARGRGRVSVLSA